MYSLLSHVSYCGSDKNKREKIMKEMLMFAFVLKFRLNEFMEKDPWLIDHALSCIDDDMAWIDIIELYIPL